MASRPLFFLVAVTTVAAVLGVARGASYTVGAPAGSWDLQTNYTRWASGINFRAGDQLVFKYSSAAHNVLEVSKASHDSCSVSSPIATFSTGDDTISLPAGGVTRYFICGVPGHCAGGMKLAVRVEAATSSAAPAPSPAPVPTTVAPRAAPASSPAASSSSSVPSPAPVAMAPRGAGAAQTPMVMTPASATAPATGGGVPAVPPPSSSATASAGAGSLVVLGFAAVVAAIMALY